MRKKLFLNTATAMLNQIVTLVCGLILPRLIISYYGSATNGVISSITQFLAFFSMMEMGVGAVVRSSLYQPLVAHDNDEISRILISSRNFFLKIGAMLCLYTIALMIYFPLAVDHSHGYLSTIILVGAIAFNSVANYLFGIIYQQLLNADQRSYVQLGISALSTLLNTCFGVVLIRMNASIEMVKLLAAFVLLLRPLLLRLYVTHHYPLNLKLTLTSEPLKQKWNGLAQHIATYILRHADTVILTICSTLENVSIYYIYHLVTNGLEQMLEVLTTGMGALLGNLYAKQELESLGKLFSAFEWMMHTFVTLLYSVAGVMILPFVRIYTEGVHDVNYIVPAFAMLLLLANGVYCIRLPYYLMVVSAGHFKQTQNSAILEALINVVLSVVFVKTYGLVGVAVGTLAAMTYRTFYLAWYLQKEILMRPFRIFAQHLFVDILTMGLIVFAAHWLPASQTTWFGWVMDAMITVLIGAVITALINLVFYRKTMIEGAFLLTRRK